MQWPKEGTREFWIERAAWAIAFQGWDSLMPSEEGALEDGPFREAVLKRVRVIEEQEREKIAAWKKAERQHKQKG